MWVRRWQEARQLTVSETVYLWGNHSRNFVNQLGEDLI